MDPTSHRRRLSAADQALLDWIRPSGPGPQPPPEAGSGWWEALLRAATPLLHPWMLHRLGREDGGGPVPGEVRGRLARALNANALLHLRRMAELRAVLEAFRPRGIEALVLKGLPLACLAYPDPSLRAMVDIDLAVPAADWPSAREALLELGLRVPGRHATRPAEGPHAMAETSKPFQRPGTRILLDLHPGLDLGSAGRLRSAGELLGASRQVELCGLPARIPRWKTFLIHLCSHCSERHLFDRGLLSLLDLDLALRRAGGISWAEERGGWLADPASARYMTLPMTLAGRLLGTPIPPIFEEVAAADPRMEELQALATVQILEAGLNLVSPGLVEVAARRPSQRLAHVARRLNPLRRSEMAGGSPLAGAALAVRRLASDLAARARIYTAAFRRGDLTRENLDRALGLHEGRARLAGLMGVELPGAPPPPSSRRPGAGEG